MNLRPPVMNLRPCKSKSILRSAHTKKLGVHNGIELAHRAVKLGLVDLSTSQEPNEPPQNLEAC